MLDKIIGASWLPILEQEFNKPYLRNLAQWISHTRESKTIYPDSQDVFKALQLCPYGQVKVVILGQDPYYNGQADGLCFSYKNGQKQGDKMQSLDVILKEIEQDVYNGFNVNYNYQLDYLAKQGILLLNTILTVFKNNALSHSESKLNIIGNGWETFTTEILISQIKEKSPKVFLIWGKEAKNTFRKAVSSKRFTGYENGEEYYDFNIGLMNHLILEAPHPASDLYNRDQFGDIKPDYPNTFSGCKHFSQVNRFLESKSIEPINWFDISEPFYNEDLKKLYQPF